MYQVQGSCARLREEIIEEIEKAIKLSLAQNKMDPLSSTLEKKGS